jgi:hypothetical protein
LCREEVERERDELLRRLKVLTEPPIAREAAAEEPEWEDTGQGSGGARRDSERRLWWRRAFGRYRSR